MKQSKEKIIQFTQEKLNAMIIAFFKVNCTADSANADTRDHKNLTFTSQIEKYQPNEYGISEFVKQFLTAMKVVGIPEQMKSHFLLFKLPSKLRHRFNSEYERNSHLRPYSKLTITLENLYEEKKN